MTLKPKQYNDDDGRVVCNMDVDGIRMHDKRVRREQRQIQKVAQGNQMTKAEARQFTWYAVLAGLLIASVFSVTWILFILFCTQIWFR
jgi:hypothetical protein